VGCESVSVAGCSKRTARFDEDISIFLCEIAGLATERTIPAGCLRDVTHPIESHYPVGDVGR
jgi:hypothetical protein